MKISTSRAIADAPDDYCVSCGAGVYFDIFVKRPASKLADVSDIEGADSLHVCGLCKLLERELVSVSGTNSHPERLASYIRRAESQT